MAESLATRVGRILSGSVHAVIETLENAAPEVVLGEAIREVDGATDDARAELGKVLARKHLATSRLGDETRAHEALVAKIDVAVDEGRDDLAEAAIARQIDIEAQMPILERTITECAEEEHDLSGFVKALLARKREMNDELERFRASQAQAGSASASGAPPPPRGARIEQRAEKASDAFDRVIRRNTGVSTHDTSLAAAARLAELEEISRKKQIQERLAEAKAGRSA